jgi:hypothetical protein
MGPVEKIELSGHPIVFIAPTTFGVPEVSSSYKAVGTAFYILNSI